MRINTNLNAMKAIKNSNKNVSSSGNSMKKLISGLSINKAADDAAGLAISEKMRSQIRGLNQAEQNAQDGILMLQTAEGTIEEVGNIVQRMRELSVQCANESNSNCSFVMAYQASFSIIIPWKTEACKEVNPMAKYLSCDQVADLYDVKVITVWDWIRKKKLPAIRIGRDYRIRPEDLERFEEQRKTC